MRSHCATHRPKVSTLAIAASMGVAAILGAPPAPAQTYSVLYSFKGGTTDGRNPAAGLIIDKAGVLFGTATEGPTCHPTPCSTGLGIAFKLTTTGTETIVHNFTGDPDGANPYGGMTANPFGATTKGGTSNLGAVFKLSATGTKVLYNFTGAPGDGAYPYAGLIEDTQGNLYGTTSAGGAFNAGAVFKLDKAGVETLLYSFTGGADGGTPYGGLLRNSAGTIIGTTSEGGITTGNCFPNGCGVVFQLSSSGRQVVLYSFSGTPDGANPYDSLVADSADNLYGTTYNGGTGPCNSGCGTVFKLQPVSKTETVLYSFAGYPVDGAYPYAGLYRDSSGNLYGTTVYGGTSDNGSVFEVNTAGTESLLYSFTGGTDGGLPHGGLVSDTKGNLYGTTYGGGVKNATCGGSPKDSCGVVFKLVP